MPIFTDQHICSGLAVQVTVTNLCRLCCNICIPDCASVQGAFAADVDASGWFTPVTHWMVHALHVRCTRHQTTLQRLCVSQSSVCLCWYRFCRCKAICATHAMSRAGGPGKHDCLEILLAMMCFHTRKHFLKLTCHQSCIVDEVVRILEHKKPPREFRRGRGRTEDQRVARQHFNLQSAGSNAPGDTSTIPL